MATENTDSPCPERGLRRIRVVSMARMKVCSCIGCPAHPGSCPELTTATRCPGCGTQYELRRGRRQARGYDAEYDSARARWKRRLDRGEAIDCHAPTCLMPMRRLLPGQPFDLGHDDERRIRGPEHQPCNRSAGGRAAHGG